MIIMVLDKSQKRIYIIGCCVKVPFGWTDILSRHRNGSPREQTPSSSLEGVRALNRVVSFIYTTWLSVSLRQQRYQAGVVYDTSIIFSTFSSCLYKIRSASGNIHESQDSSSVAARVLYPLGMPFLHSSMLSCCFLLSYVSNKKYL